MDVGRYGNIEFPVEKFICLIRPGSKLHLPVFFKLSFYVTGVSYYKSKEYKSKQKYSQNFHYLVLIINKILNFYDKGYEESRVK